MTDCVGFLQWALPRLRMRWRGFRRVRRQVCRRVKARCRALGLDGFDAYRAHLERHPDEWPALDACLRIPISRFYRDRAVFDRLRELLDPEWACWCAGCASGEEPYTLALLGVRRILATDTDPHLLARARAASYAPSSLKELPPELKERGFSDGVLRRRYRDRVEFRREDIRETMPPGPFDLVLCRNLAFTYFDEALQAGILERIRARLRAGGLLVVGGHETVALPRLAPGIHVNGPVPPGPGPGA